MPAARWVKNAGVWKNYTFTVSAYFVKVAGIWETHLPAGETARQIYVKQAGTWRQTAPL